MFPTKSTLYILPLLYILAITTAFSICANDVSKNNIAKHNIEIELFLKEHRLKAVDHVLLPCTNAEKVSFFINKSFQVLSVSIPTRELDFKTASSGDGQRLEILIPSDLRQSDSMVLDIAYEGFLSEKPGSLEKEDVGETTGIISEEGVYLSPACMWYPDIPNSLSTFRVTIVTPTGYEAVMQGTLVSKKSDTDKIYTTWEEKNVSEDCHLVAGRYKVTSIKHNGIDIYAYFFPEEQGLVETYINATKRYLDMYQKLLGELSVWKIRYRRKFFPNGIWNAFIYPIGEHRCKIALHRGYLAGTRNSAQLVGQLGLCGRIPGKLV